MNNEFAINEGSMNTVDNSKYGSLNLIDWLKGRFKIHKEGWRICGVILFVSLILGFLWIPLAVGGVILAVSVALFFRDPIRYVPTKPDLVIAPADGTVLTTRISKPPLELALSQEPHFHVAIFLSVLDVHINRSPIEGMIIDSHYEPGKFLSANDPEAGIRNERLGLTIETNDGDRLSVVQISGAIARRIVKWVSIGENIGTGEKYGLIRFGSRVDVWMPLSYQVEVSQGQRTLGGETIIARKNTTIDLDDSEDSSSSALVDQLESELPSSKTI